MQHLYLDEQFKPFSGLEVGFEKFTFSGGEPHIRIDEKLDVGDAVRVTHRLTSFNDFGLLLYALDALQRLNVEQIEVFIPYFPAARQDRVVNKGEPLSVKVNADLLNHFNLSKVIVFDPHSEVTPAVINHCQPIKNHSFIKKVLQQIQRPITLVSPDGGALKKIYTLSEALGGFDIVECSKHRDPKSGKLSEFIIYADDLKGKDYLIVDDICDGGGTFCGIAREMKRKNAGNIYVAASHGIFSKGFEELDSLFSHIFCTNSVKDILHPSLTQIKIDQNIIDY